MNNGLGVCNLLRVVLDKRDSGKYSHVYIGGHVEKGPPVSFLIVQLYKSFDLVYFALEDRLV